MVWNRKTGASVANALVWQDTRVAADATHFVKTVGHDLFRHKTGLPLTTYFSGLKIRWILEHVPGRSEAVPKRATCHLRQHRHVPGLEPDRRREWRHPRHRRHQCQPHAIDEPGNAGMG